jgi:hypothetical protein
MARVTEQDRHTYKEKVKSYNAMIETLIKAEKNSPASHKHENTTETALGKITLADEMLNLASNYIAINGVSQVVLRTKNEEALNDGRKALYKAVIYLEDVVTNYVDAPFSDYEDKLALIESFDANQRYQLVRKMGLAIDLLENAYGDNSKWRWTFVELEGRFAAVAKNIIDLRNAIANSSPESPNYESTVYHFRLVKKLLSQSADRYREKYELSTGQMHDFKTGIAFLAALKRLHTVLSDREDAEEVKKKLNIWTTKFETDLKKQEEEKKKL